MRRLRLSIAGFVAGIICCIQTTAQGQMGPAFSEMQSIYKSYDSLQYLTFDVEFEYNTDTILGHHTYDKVSGYYTMNRKRALYKLADITFMQNESVLIGIYERDKFMIVGNPRFSSAGGFLPMRSMIDSLFDSTFQHYTVTLTQSQLPNELSVIEFTRADSVAQFDKFRITYNQSHLITAVSYEYKGMPDNPMEFENMDPQQQALLNVMRKKTLTVKFDGYRFTNTARELYETNSYIFKEDGQYKPVAKYADYMIYNSGN